MSNAPTFPITVFYDGSCSVCAAEVKHYRRKDHEGRLVLIDISAPDFRPELYGIDRKGKVYRGIDSFRAIWQAFPASTRYGMMGTLVTLPVINPLARLCYKGFSRIRRYLPKRNGDCTNGTCRIRETR